MKQSLGYRLLILTGVALLLIWSLGPIYWTLVSSVTPSADFSARPIHFFPQRFTFDHFSRLLGINIAQIGGVEVWAQFRAALVNSIVTSIAATIVLRGDLRTWRLCLQRGSNFPAEEHFCRGSRNACRSRLCRSDPALPDHDQASPRRYLCRRRLDLRLSLFAAVALAFAKRF